MQCSSPLLPLNAAAAIAALLEYEHVGRPKPSEGGGVREVPPHVSYDMLCLSLSQEID